MFGFGIRLMLKIKFGLKLIGWFSLIEFKLKARGIASTQKAVLQDILNTSKDTEFGKKYHFGAILDEKLQEDLLNNFQKIVPVSEHSNFEFYIERCKSGHVDVLFPAKPKFFVTAYSVLNKPKWIPISNKYYQEVFYRINAVWFYNLLKINSKTFNGPMIPALSGCVSGTTLNGTVYTSAPAYTQKEAPFFFTITFCFSSRGVFYRRSYSSLLYYPSIFFRKRHPFVGGSKSYLPTRNAIVSGYLSRRFDYRYSKRFFE